ncbi:Transposon Tn7 transposition protein tnsB [Serratia rubidaea]|uniref:Transposon Tn7 transposition protein tnsB n=1 Tax=Serratia rubidaea TaxID=61652 RepID=A0A3S4I0J1_SERRU|nr:Transposon Tn7 transposition protein tnsB [Serratia rubidaea]
MNSQQKNNAMNIQQEHYDGEAFEPRRALLSIEIGALVSHLNESYKIIEIIDFQAVVGVNLLTGRHASLRINELRALEGTQTVSDALSIDLDEITDEDWKTAQKRFEAIRPLIEHTPVSKALMEVRAQEYGVTPMTLYRWMKRYNSAGSVSALVPMKRGWASGKSRLSPEVENIIVEIIDSFFLKPQRPSARKTVLEVENRCKQLGIKPPNHTSVRRRIASLSEKTVLRGRGRAEKARNKFTPKPGSFPNADYPLAVVQIDHTEADVILVDDIYRKPIGRPWLTLAIDVCTRMITGYYISFDAPSQTSVAMCVAHSILPKEEWMMLHDVEADWPVWGKPSTIHVDNGPDFRSENFRHSCAEYGINLEFRPVKRPHYGAHIERLMGTVMGEVHNLPGTTFSSIVERMEYDSDKNAVLTMSEFEQWLVTYITKVYHQRLHMGIGLSPIKMWERGIFGNATEFGIGLPAKPADRLTTQLDFMPSFRRTVQTFGVTHESLKYYGEPLRPWINVKDRDTGQAWQHVFRYDPRDISTVWFFDPELKMYFRIPFANQSLPSMSLWEHRQVMQKLKAEGVKSVNESLLLTGLTEMRQIVDEASSRSRKARRQQQRRKVHQSGITPATPGAVSEKVTSSPTPLCEQEDTRRSLPFADDLITGDIELPGDIA